MQQVEVGEQLDVCFLLLKLGVEAGMVLEFVEDGVLQQIEDVLGDDWTKQTFGQRRQRSVAIGQFNARKCLRER